ncbi:MAG: hypothetical protein A3H98_09665 [Bacteroidetes bacterium RIFCSPLOWO2_02_FULL_36_8]|nr:MAG: hypothetical protein A3H98_09665 [Bacteroidetes bacterium RIFCSPLOWO2_02_FULL_36_8]
MQNFIYISLIAALQFFFCNQNLYSQNPPSSFCATENFQIQDEKVLSFYKNLKKNIRLGEKFYIPVQFHITGSMKASKYICGSDSGYFCTKDLLTLMCELNNRFSSMNIQFFLYDLPIYIPNSKYHNFTWENNANIIYASYVWDVLNVYITGNAAGNCGYAWPLGVYPNEPNQGGVVLNKDCTKPGSSTLAHELGHHFSLFHPFHNWKTIPEFVKRDSGANCDTHGDFFCDTPADFLDYRWNCPYTQTKADVEGDLYEPDGSLYMSYSNDECQNRFSLQEQSAIVHSLLTERNELLNHPLPDTLSDSLFSQPVLYSPSDSDTVSRDTVVFRWSSVPGATWYVITQWKFTNAFLQSFITCDTFYASVYNYGSSYWKWNVKAITESRFCQSMPSPVSNFKGSNLVYFNDSLPKMSISCPFNRKETSSSNKSKLPQNVFQATLFPNPGNVDVHPQLRIYSPASEEVSVTIYSIEGRKIYEELLNIHTGLNRIHLTSTPNHKGIYLIQLISKEHGQWIFLKWVVL